MTAVNIKNGIDIFGVTGNFSCPSCPSCPATATGNAVAADVLTGKTFSNSSSNGISGSMVNQGASNITPDFSAGNHSIVAGYYNGSGAVVKDSNLIAANIKSGTAIFGVTGSANIATYPSPVPKTKQTSCFDNTTHAIDVDCVTPGPSPANEYDGQDALENRGKVWSNPRFTDNGNGTITDNNTGLIWLKDASCATLAGIDANGAGTWLVARSAAEALANGTCGLSDGSNAGDWHLPNVKELQSLIDFQYVFPALSDAAGTAKWTEGNPFSGVVSFDYWSSTTNVNGTVNAWIVDLSNGVVNVVYKGNNLTVWPVRGGQ